MKQRLHDGMCWHLRQPFLSERLGAFTYTSYDAQGISAWCLETLMPCRCLFLCRDLKLAVIKAATHSASVMKCSHPARLLIEVCPSSPAAVEDQALAEESLLRLCCQRMYISACIQATLTCRQALWLGLHTAQSGSLVKLLFIKCTQNVQQCITFCFLKIEAET